MPDELGYLQKGDELWLVTQYSLSKAKVKRVWSLHRTTVVADTREIDLRTRCEGDKYTDAAVWLEHRRGYSHYGRNTTKAYLRESDAQEDFRIRKLNSRRKELERWIDKAPVEAIEKICAIKDAQQSTEDNRRNMTELIEKLLYQLPGGRSSYRLSLTPIESDLGHEWSVRICQRHNDHAVGRAIRKTIEDAIRAAFEKAKPLNTVTKSQPTLNLKRNSRVSKKEREVGYKLCPECGECDEPHKHCNRKDCQRWTDGVSSACDNCLLADSRSEI